MSAAPPEVPKKKAKKRPASAISDVDSGNDSLRVEVPAAGGGEAAGSEGREPGEGDEQASGEDAMLGKRGEPGANGGTPKKKRRVSGPTEPMNALVHLNKLRPGAQFKFVSQTGPVHSPVFVMEVEVNQQVFQGQGNSKKLAKLKAAELALKSFVQFPDASEAHQLLGRGFLPSTADFTSDADVSSSGACGSLFSDFSGARHAKNLAGNAGGTNTAEGEACTTSSADGQTPVSEMDVYNLSEVSLW